MTEETAKKSRKNPLFCVCGRCFGGARLLHGVHSACVAEGKRETWMSGCGPEGGTDEVITLVQRALRRKRPSRCVLLMWSGDGDNDLDTRQEPDNQRGVGDIQNVRGEGISGTEGLSDGHTIRERGDIQHVLMTGFGYPKPGRPFFPGPVPVFPAGTATS